MDLQRSSGKEAGGATVELAFLLVLLLLIAAGTFEFGRAFWYYNALAKATRDGARVVSLAPDIAAAQTGAKNLVRDAVVAARLSPELTADNVEITTICDDDPCAGGVKPRYVKVQIVDYTIDIGGLFPFFSPVSRSIWRAEGVPLSPYTVMPYMG